MIAMRLVQMVFVGFLPSLPPEGKNAFLEDLKTF
jgi:hypothetical protein